MGKQIVQNIIKSISLSFIYNLYMQSIKQSKFIKENQSNPQQENCEICYQQYNKYQQDQTRPNAICYQCWLNHVKTSLTKISYQVGTDLMSPFEGGPDIDVCLALNSLHQQHKQEMEEWLFKKYTTFTVDIEKCPSETCDFVFMMQKCKWGAKIQHKCPKCDMPLTAPNTFSIKSTLGLIYFIFMANKCPKCEIPIEKTSGCPHMTCPCGHQFCWFCLKDHSHNLNNLYTVHEPKQCAFIFFSKIIMLLTCIFSLILTAFGTQFFQEMTDCLIVALLVDLWLAAVFLLVNHLIYTRNYQPNAFKMISFLNSILMITIVNILLIILLIYVDWIWQVLLIVFIQSGVCILGAGIIFLVIFSVETWFDFIC